MKKATMGAVSALLMTMAATTAHAAPVQDIKAKEGKPWVHKDSRFAFPASIASFSRRSIRDISDGKQIDLSGTYDDAATGTVATVYLYRPAMPDPALWFDISNWYLQHNSQLGKVGAARAPATFQAGSTPGTAALRQSYSLEASGPASTGVAIVPVGRWLVKLRMTSASLSAAALDQTMRGFLDALAWPSNAPAADSIPIGVCAKPLSTTKAEERQQSSAVILVGAMLASLAEEPDKTSPENPPARLCRNDDGQNNAVHPLYQLVNGQTGYVQPLGDNGTLLVVRDDPTSAAIADTDRNGGKQEDGGQEGGGRFFRVTLMTPERWAQYPAFATLPSPDQAIDVLEHRAPLSVTSFLKKIAIQLNPETFK